MISSIAFKQQQQPQNSNKTTAIFNIGTTLGGIALGSYGIHDYRQAKDTFTRAQEQEVLNAKSKLPDTINRILSDCIKNSEYYKNNYYNKVKAVEECMSTPLGDILSTVEYDKYNSDVKILSQKYHQHTKPIEDTIQKITDEFLSKSEYAKNNNITGECHLCDLIEKTGLFDIKDYLTEAEMKEFEAACKSEKASLDRINSLRAYEFENLKRNAIINSEHINSDYPKIPLSFQELKKQNIELKDILSTEELKEYLQKYENEEKRLKELEEKSIATLKENLKKCKTKNINIIAGGGFGIALVSLISLLMLGKNNRGTTKNAN